MSFDINNLKIGVIGLGYVGLPLAVEFGKRFPTVGFDINVERVAELKGGTDSTLECSDEELAEATHLEYATDIEAIGSRWISAERLVWSRTVSGAQLGALISSHSSRSWPTLRPPALRAGFTVSSAATRCASRLVPWTVRETWVGFPSRSRPV